MLAIRMQRTGRKGHAMFRMVVQDARRTPTSGKVVARLGSYDPHAKSLTLDKEKASFYLEHGAQPSDRVAVLLQKEGVKLPDWVKLSADKKRDVRNPDKRRSTRPPEEAAEEAPAAKEAAETPATEAQAEAAPAEAGTDETPAEADAAESADSEEKEAPADAESSKAEAETEAAAEKPEKDESDKK